MNMPMHKKFFRYPVFYFFILSHAHVLSITYNCINYGITTKIHSATINPKEYSIIAVRADYNEKTGAKRRIAKRKAQKNSPKRLEPVISIAHRYATAVVAINGGFFKANGDAAGILKINNTWHGLSTKQRGAIGWLHDNSLVLIDRILTTQNKTIIPHLDSSDLSYKQWNSVDSIIGGAPVLIHNGMIISDYSNEQTLQSFLTTRHNRTAIGIKENGDWVLVVVEGRLYGLIGGMTMQELAYYMYNLGCINAVNLDGGTSSTMIINHKKVTTYNTKVSDALVVILRSPTD